MSCRTGRIAGLVGFGIAGVLAVTAANGVGWNLTNSEPPGLWRTAGAALPATLGEYVAACPPRSGVVALAARRGYIAPGDCPTGLTPLLKQVAAVAGDTVRVTDAGISVNGRPLPHTAPLASDSRGRPLPHVLPGTYLVEPGTVWLLSTYNARSFDSRYFGPVPVAALRARLRPIAVEHRP